MSSRVLAPKYYIDEFKKLVKLSQCVWIASAWITPNRALTYLLESKCQMKAIIGTHNCITVPRCLEQMIENFKSENVRIVLEEPSLEEQESLFHPKVYIFFRSEGSPIAWIGSANFTSGGFCKNRVIILESDDFLIVSELKEWFNNQWNELRCQNVKDDLEKYTKRYKNHKKREQLYITIEKEELIPKNPIYGIEILPKTRDRHIKGHNYIGTIRLLSGDKPRKKDYSTASNALDIVLTHLAAENRNLLEKCEKHRAFQIHHREPKGVSRLLAHGVRKSELFEMRARSGELGSDAQKRSMTNPQELKKGCGWWRSNDIGAKYAWRMIKACCILADVELHPNKKDPGI